ncbi:calcium-binding protein, partial [Parvularcula marina]|uniref:calcium-binding protein n=1 Tax=Parvularcula marina TaxID=2292771 RepID=UPI0035160463
GDDTLIGGADDDLFLGGAGADDHQGDGGTDEVDYSGSASGVTLSLSTGGSGGDAAGDSYTSIENVTGSGSDDDITGDSGDNVIDGGDGNDTLEGGGGADTLNGGAGNDTFNLDEDLIDLSSIIDGGTGDDTVNVSDTSGGGFNAADLFSTLHDVEVIDFTGAGVSATIDLNAAAVQAMTDADNELTLYIDGDDTLNLTGTYTTDVVSGTETVYTFTDAMSNPIAELTVFTG